MDDHTVHERGLLGNQPKRIPPPAQQQQSQPGTGLSIDELGAALRLTTGEPVPEPTQSILERQLAVAEAEIGDYAPGADTFSRAQAIIMLVGFLVDSPNTALNNAPQVNVLRMSGAMSLVSRWHVL